MTPLPLSPFANALAWTLMHFLWQGALVAMAYWAILECANFRLARTRYTAALVALSVMAACPLLTFATVYDAAEETGQAVAVSLRTELASQPPSTERPIVVGPSAEMETSTVVVQRPVATTAAASSRLWNECYRLLGVCRPYLLVFWVAGVVLSGARLMSGLVNIAWLRRGRTPIAAALAERSRRMATRLGLKKACVFSSRYIREAAVVGFWRPVVLLPASWLAELPADVLEAVIAHELAHIRRYDVWVNLLQRFIETLLFYHPAVWWISNQMRLEREMCCDELAVEATGERGNYVIALEQVGRLQVRGTLNLATSFFGDRKMKLLSRVKNVLNATGQPHREPAWLVGAVAIVFPLLVLGSTLFPATQSPARAQEREGTRSAEEKAGVRRSAEEREGVRRSAEGERRAPGIEALRGFKPQTQREAALLQMIMQLQRDVAELRRVVQSRRDGGDAREGESARRDGSAEEGLATQAEGEGFTIPARWQNTKEGRVFKAYDKNGDELVSLDEWLEMTNANVNSARRQIQSIRFREAEPSGDGKFTPAEFIYWYRIGRHKGVEKSRTDGARDGERSAKRGPRDGERSAERGPRDGEGSAERGPRDGEGSAKRGPRDGERSAERGPRDGEGSAERGPRDGERSAERGPRDGERSKEKPQGR